MKPTTLDRKVRSVESEACVQARYWLGRGDLGPRSIDMAFAVIISGYIRAVALRGDMPRLVTDIRP